MIASKVCSSSLGKAQHETLNYITSSYTQGGLSGRLEMLSIQGYQVVGTEEVNDRIES